MKNKNILENSNQEWTKTLPDSKKDLKSYYPFNVVNVPNKNNLWLTIGETINGPHQINMSDEPHILISGQAGVGKSHLLHTIFCNLVENYTQKELELYLLTPNYLLEFYNWKDVKQVKKLIDNINTACQTIYDLEKELDRRLNLLLKAGKRNINAYNNLVSEDEKLPFILIVMEELYEYTLLPHLAKIDKETGELKNIYNQETFFSKIVLIMSKSRALGIHFIISTQRSTGDILPKMISSQCSVRLGFSTSNTRDSLNIIDEKGLEKIPSYKKGRGILANGILTDFQTYHITDNQLKTICQKHKQ